MKRFILLFIALLPSTFCLLPIHATTLDDCMRLLEHQTLQSDAVLTIASDVSQPLHYSGSVTMCGDKFKVSIFGIDAAYDGQTMYMYIEDTDELTLSNPSNDELLQANPFLFAKALIRSCHYTERTDAQGDYWITLTPSDKEAAKGVSRFVLHLNQSLMPLSVEVHEGKKTTTLSLRNPQFVTATVDYTIRKDGAYLNDLR